MDVVKCICMVNFSHGNKLELIDLVFLDGVPHLVFTWHDDLKLHPDAVLAIERSALQDAPPNYPAKFLYTTPLQDPGIPGARAN